MKRKISLSIFAIVILLINLTLSVQYTPNNNQVSISYLESRADGNTEVKDPDPGEKPVTNSETPEEWTLSSILDYLLNL